MQSRSCKGHTIDLSAFLRSTSEGMWSSIKVALVHHHTYAWGPSHELGEYLSERVQNLILVEHPFHIRKYYGSSITVYADGSIKRKVQLPSIRAPQLVLLIKDFIVTVWYLLSARMIYDLYVGVDCFNAFVGLILKKLGLVRIVVFYAIDYTPRRFNNRIINGMYHVIEKFSILNSDRVWNMSQRMREIWVRYYGANPENNKVVPNCYDVSEIPRPALEEIDRYRIVYLGSLEHSKGLDLALKALPRLIEKFPRIKLLIIGTGPQEAELKDTCNKMRLGNHVFFAGHIANIHKCLRLLSECGLGIALHLPSDVVPMNLYGDPGKVKAYLACGLPVVMTRSPEIASVIEKEGAGTVIDYDVDSFVSAVEYLLRDQELYLKCRAKALHLASRFSCDAIFGEAFSDLFNLVKTKRRTPAARESVITGKGDLRYRINHYKLNSHAKKDL